MAPRVQHCRQVRTLPPHPDCAGPKVPRTRRLRSGHVPLHAADTSPARGGHVPRTRRSRPPPRGGHVPRTRRSRSPHAAVTPPFTRIGLTNRISLGVRGSGLGHKLCLAGSCDAAVIRYILSRTTATPSHRITPSVQWRETSAPPGCRVWHTRQVTSGLAVG